MGEVRDGYAGLLLPPKYDPILNEEFRSLPVDAAEPKRLEVGDVITDGKGNVQVMEIDEDTRTILFESVYSSENGKPMHYTWQIKIEEGSDGNSSDITSRTRMENLKHPKVGRVLWPKIDRHAMKILGEGIARDDSDTSKQSLREKIGANALIGMGKVRDYKRGRSKK
jgi:hypothetical protein